MLWESWRHTLPSLCYLKESFVKCLVPGKIMSRWTASEKVYALSVFQQMPPDPTEDGLEGPAHPGMLRLFRVNIKTLNDPLSEARPRKSMLLVDKRARISALVAYHLCWWVTVAGSFSFLGARPFYSFMAKSEVGLNFTVFSSISSKGTFSTNFPGNKGIP